MKKLVLSIIAVALLVMPLTALAGNGSPSEGSHIKRIVNEK
ncbi:hypothetical protein [Numidum massiliense]|nr:hypothetical protein [Numidum massiliense]